MRETQSVAASKTRVR